MNTGHRAKLQCECVVLVLQGGGALGAYQAGVFEGMAEAAMRRTGSQACRLVRSMAPI